MMLAYFDADAFFLLTMIFDAARFRAMLYYLHTRRPFLRVAIR